MNSAIFFLVRALAAETENAVAFCRRLWDGDQGDSGVRDCHEAQIESHFTIRSSKSCFVGICLPNLLRCLGHGPLGSCPRAHRAFFLGLTFIERA